MFTIGSFTIRSLIVRTFIVCAGGIAKIVYYQIVYGIGKIADCKNCWFFCKS